MKKTQQEDTTSSRERRSVVVQLGVQLLVHALPKYRIGCRLALDGYEAASRGA